MNLPFLEGLDMNLFWKGFSIIMLTLNIIRNFDWFSGSSNWIQS